MFNILLFSRDRPAQLHLALSSLYKYFRCPKIYVSYRYTSEKFKAGYDKLTPQFQCDFWPRHDFMFDVEKFLNLPGKYSMFMTDDSIFF